MSQRPYRDPYEKLFLELCKRVEKWLLRLIAGAIALLVLVQLLLQFPWMRSMMTRVDRLEGVPYRHGEQAELPAESPSSSIRYRN